MRSPSRLGVSVGLVAVAVSVVGNLRRGDPHLVSAFPDLLSLAVVWLAMFVAMRRLATLPPSTARNAAVHLTTVAAMVDAIGMAAFTVWYLPPHPLSLGVVGGLAAAVLMALIGWAAARLALRPTPAPRAPVA
jgi:hypothetical protein